MGDLKYSSGRSRGGAWVLPPLILGKKQKITEGRKEQKLAGQAPPAP